MQDKRDRNSESDTEHQDRDAGFRPIVQSIHRRVGKKYPSLPPEPKDMDIVAKAVYNIRNEMLGLKFLAKNDPAIARRVKIFLGLMEIRDELR